ncbi:MAG: PAS domain S-box protein [Desulfobulbaceae bacterium]|nr:PAS domain S-box protein [Desulfobulbaceae bacterium]
MGTDHITRAELEQELKQMTASLRDLEKCRNALLKSRQEYERIIETAPDAMVFINRQGTIVVVNAQLEDIFGYASGQLINQDLAVLIPPRFREKHKKLLAQYFANPVTRPMGVNYEIYALHENGREFPVDISLSALEIDGEQLAVASIRNISERKQIEEKLEHNFHIQRVTSSVLKVALEPLSLDEQLEGILDLILTIPHLSLQSKGGICLVDDESGDLILKAVRGFQGADKPPCLRLAQGKCLCTKAVKTGEVVFSDCFHENDDGAGPAFPHGHYCVPIVSGNRSLGLINVFVKEGHKRKDSEEEFLVSIANTLTGILERNKAAEEKEMLQEQLVQMEKQAALGRLTANVAHEIRNPLTAVGGFARRLYKSLQDRGKEKEYAQIIVSEVDRLEKTLKKVLIISKEMVAEKELHDIHALLEEVLYRYEFLCNERSITVEKSFQKQLPPILIDQEHVKEAILNIVANAISSMPGGGTLTAATSEETVEGKQYARVRIEDTGTGIDEEKLNMLFEPFFTVREPVKGIGLGLILAQKVLEEQDGFLRIKSKVGIGTSLDLLFPLPPQ